MGALFDLNLIDLKNYECLKILDVMRKVRLFNQMAEEKEYKGLWKPFYLEDN